MAEWSEKWRERRQGEASSEMLPPVSSVGLVAPMSQLGTLGRL